MNYNSKDGFPYYFDLVKGKDLHKLFSSRSVFTFLTSINEEDTNYRYGPNKWNIKQVVGHIIDHERIKMFRAFQLSRKMEVELWGYDQNLLVDNAQFEALYMESLIKDFSNVRQASNSFITLLSNEQLKIKGKARKYQISLEEFLYSIIGHERHHINIIKEKYLNLG